MTTESIRLFRTAEHTCGYYADRRAQNLVLDPAGPDLGRFYPSALSQGFRRAGGVIYRPNCTHCSACIPCRIPVAHFNPNRSQRRALARNADVDHQLLFAAERNVAEHMALYRRYLAARHAGGGMDDPSLDDYERFLLSPWSTTRFLELRLNGELIGNAVTDLTDSAASAVYTYYSPDHAPRSLGTLSVLLQLEYCRRLRLEHLYLGYWIAGHPKMDYKRQFLPAEHYVAGKWVVAIGEIVR
jgi:arginine-tRNA-protein transferase